MPRQSDLKFVFTSASSVPFDVIKFNLKEGISECFELRLDLVSINPSVDFGQILDRPALLTIWHGDMPVRYVHGIVTAFVQGDTGFRRTRYSVLIEPSLKRAEFCSDWRITRQRTIPQLLQQLINEQGISDYEQRLYGTHLPREYCVQPGETTLYHCDRIPAARDYEEQLPGNQGKVNPYTATTIEARNAAAADWQRVTVTSVDREGFYQRVTTMESPNQARQRRMNAPLKDQDSISFHSAIPANPEHSRRALAYDVAIGQARSLEDPAFYAYLCRVADWRLGWNKAKLASGQYGQKVIDNGTLSDAASETDLAFLAQEPADIRALIQATAAYRQNGKLPRTAHDAPLPGLVATQTVYERDKGKPVRMGGVPPSLKPL
ncbi:effector protein Tle3 domain-containing protein [Paraburkholderia tropica]|uniref:effector protein Tle3 domain-containing protein n=1 Tax=Paraburkholderia tropica TaxID=92647 RepID=UPI002ABD2875|nr:contractile injection system protein, VgrG/Pvc8 family [Paraburkholderia tropica]